MFLAEFLEGIELDEIAHGASSRFSWHRLQQAQFDTLGRLAVPDAQGHANLASAPGIRAEASVFLTVEKVVKTFHVIAESERGGVSAVVRNVLDQFVRPLTIEFVPRSGARPLDPVPVHEPPTCALVLPG